MNYPQEIDYHIELSSLKEFANKLIENKVVPIDAQYIFSVLKQAVINSEVAPFLRKPITQEKEGYYEKYLRLEEENNSNNVVPDFFGYEGDFYDLDKNLNFSRAYVNDEQFQVLFGLKLIELYSLKANIKEYKEEDIVKPGQKVISVNDEVFDDLFKKILASLHTENIFVGLNNTLLSDFSFMMGKDFEVDILPKVNIIKANNNYKVVFKKTGEYMLRFYDLRKGKKVLFEKKIMVNPIPDPIVKVRGDNLSNYSISIKDLLSAERLEAKLEINNLNFFPGRINSFKVIRIHNGKEEESVNNYGELFQSPTQKVLGALKKNDFLIFDNVNMSLVDGSTRTSAPIIYKITD